MLLYKEYLEESKGILPNAGLYVHQIFATGLVPTTGKEIFAFDVPVKDGKPDFDSLPEKDRKKYMRAWQKQKNNTLVTTGDLKIGMAKDLDVRISDYFKWVSLDKLRTTRIHMANIDLSDLKSIEKLSNQKIPNNVFIVGSSNKKTEWIDGKKASYQDVFKAAVDAYTEYMKKNKPDLFEPPSLWSHEMTRASSNVEDPKQKYLDRRK